MDCFLGVGDPRQGGTSAATPRRHVSWALVDDEAAIGLLPWRGDPRQGGTTAATPRRYVSWALVDDKAAIGLLPWHGDPRQGGDPNRTPKGLWSTSLLGPVGLSLRMLGLRGLIFPFLLFYLDISRSF